MTTSKISETYRVTLVSELVWDYSPHDTGSYSTCKLLRAVEDISGVLGVTSDISDKKSFFVTIDGCYYFSDIKKMIRTLDGELDA